MEAKGSGLSLDARGTVHLCDRAATSMPLSVGIPRFKTSRSGGVRSDSHACGMTTAANHSELPKELKGLVSSR